MCIFRPNGMLQISTFWCIFAAIGHLPRETVAENFGWEAVPHNHNWGFPGNWAGTPNEVPDDDSDVAFISGLRDHYPTLTANQIVGSLSIWGGGRVYTGNGTDNFKLAVRDSGPYLGTTLIEGPLSWLVVENSPLIDDFDTNRLDIRASGTLFVNDGAKVRVRSAMGIAENALVSGTGRVEINGSQTVTNNGTIQAAGGELTVAGTGAFARLDWDGDTGNGNLRAFDNSALNLNILTVGPFSGTMTIDANASMYMADSWSQGQGGILNFDGGTGTATLAGSGATLADQINVLSGTAVFQAATTFGQDSNLALSDGTTVQFNAPATMNSPASFDNASGTTLIVNDEVNIGSGVGHFDWDGSLNLGMQSQTIVNPGGLLDLDVDSVDFMGAAESYDGRLSINSGQVQIQNNDGQWQMSGSLELNNTDGTPAQLTGVGVFVSGDVNVGGDGRSIMIASPTFNSDSQIHVADGAILSIESQIARFFGGTFSGDGVVSLDASPTIVGASTTVNMPNGTFDLDGEIVGDTVQLDAPLILNVNSLDTALFNDPTECEIIINNLGRLDVNLTNGNSYRLDGDVFLNGAMGGLTSLHFAGDQVTLSGTTEVTGNSASQASMRFHGHTLINANSTLGLRGGSSDQHNFIRHDATFSGDGILAVRPTKQLEIEQGASLSVRLRNEGRLELSNADLQSSIGTVLVNDNYDQLATGAISLELAAEGNDQLQVSGFLNLAGEIAISTVGSYAPGAGDVFTLITAGFRVGTFDSFSLVTPDQLDVSGVLRYTANSVLYEITEASLFGDFNGDMILDCDDVDALVGELSVGGMGAAFDLNGDAAVNTDDLDLWLAEAGSFNIGAGYLYGDANLDGVVDVSDFNVWNDNKFSSTAAWCSGDFNADGSVDVSDFNVWNGNKFTSSLPVAVPEPNLHWIAFFGTLLAASVVRSKNSGRR